MSWFKSKYPDKYGLMENGKCYYHDYGNYSIESESVHLKFNHVWDKPVTRYKIFEVGSCKVCDNPWKRELAELTEAQHEAMLKYDGINKALKYNNTKYVTDFMDYSKGVPMYDEDGIRIKEDEENE